MLNNKNIATIIIVILLVGVGYYLYTRVSPIQNEGELRFDNSTMNQKNVHVNQSDLSENVANVYNQPVNTTGVGLPPRVDALVGQGRESSFAQSTVERDKQNAASFPKAQLTPAELLPQDNASAWAKLYPNGSGNLDNKNFLQAGWAMGINTVGQTLRNANQQLRSDPPNPQVVVSPWLQSTITPDTQRRELEIGSNC